MLNKNISALKMPKKILATMNYDLVVDFKQLSAE